jgi:hypothetical protein
MKSKELTVEITALEEQRATLATQLDALIHAFQKQLPSVAEPWIRREVERRIEDHPDRVEELGIEKLKILKNRMNSLISELPEIVEKETSDKQDWPHYRAKDTSGYKQNKNEPFFNKAFRNVISHIGTILDEFGLLTEPKGHVPNWKQTANGKFRFAINPGFESLSIQPVKKFVNLEKEYETLITKLNEKKAELAKAKAKELWEST